MVRYAPRGKYLWDPWFLEVDGVYHLFHLQASKKYSVNERHHHASIGHATSTNLYDWEKQPLALEAGPRGSWDSKCLWTGCTIQKGNKFYLFYTGRSKKDNLMQSIGVAVSDDLITWKKYDKNPLLEIDTRYYDATNKRNTIGQPPAWRDPFVFYEDKDECYYMLISARKKSAKNVYNGCLALAKSTNLFDWEVLPPINISRRYDQVEVPAVIKNDGKYYLFFSTNAKSYPPETEYTYGIHEGLHCFYSDDLFGEFKPINGFGVVFANGKRKYDIQFVKKDGEFYSLGSIFLNKRGKFVGKLSYPAKVIFDGNVIMLDSHHASRKKRNNKS